MRRSWVGMLGLVAALLMNAGCQTAAPDLGTRFLTAIGWKSPEPDLKPPPHPEDLITPPEDDARFSKPVEYPPDTLNQDLVKRKGTSPGPGGPGGPGGGSGGPSSFGLGGPGRGY